MPVQVAPLPIPLFQARTGALFRAREPKVVPQFLSRQIFTEFYCQTTGSNLNGGSDTNDSAHYTSTNGNWDSTNGIFTPTDGSTPKGTVIPFVDYLSIYVDGSTTTGCIALVIAVAAGVNGAITISSTNAGGIRPSTSATGRSVKAGGAWKGPNGADTMPFSFNALTAAKDVNNNPIRVNFKNNATYLPTAAMTIVSTGIVWQGYRDTPGDGGRATFDFSTNAVNGLNSAASGCIYADFIFQANFTTNAGGVGGAGGIGHIYYRITAVGWGGYGFFAGGSGQGSVFIECEAYNCNRSNSSPSGGFVINNLSILHRCVAAGCLGSNNAGFVTYSSNGGMTAHDCISFGNTYGFIGSATTNKYVIMLTNCDAYNNVLDGIIFNDNNVISFVYLENCNIVKNGRYGIGTNQTTGNYNLGFIVNCRFGSGSMANQAGALQGGFGMKNITIIDGIRMLSGGQTPWLDPTNANFSSVLPEVLGMGRGNFTQSQGGFTGGTQSYPDIGAAQSPPSVTVLSGGGTNIQTLPYGYVGYFYAWKWGFAQNTIITLQSGSLPPGIILSQPRSDLVYLTGIPTLAGSYNFTLRATIDTTYVDSPFEIAVQTDPTLAVAGGGFASGF